MKAIDMRGKTVVELRALLLEELRSQFNLRMRKGVDQDRKTSEIKKTRRNIARIKTIINEKT